MLGLQNIVRAGVFSSILRQMAGPTNQRMGLFMMSAAQSQKYKAFEKYKALEDAASDVGDIIETMRKGAVRGSPLVIRVPPVELSAGEDGQLNKMLGRTLELLGLAMQEKGDLATQLAEILNIQKEAENFEASKRAANLSPGPKA